jgi:hypothetical protein
MDPIANDFKNAIDWLWIIADPASISVRPEPGVRARRSGDSERSSP